ncbi:magnesium transporter [Cellulomonas bogoriensis]|uniref:Magnesium transporter MgtE n=1 Tax=Cellulomonas bogoriensis 69B4 = DSM 16987 TaxID=1386082 RepID=A0A0A0BU59_9CELL|nr:magnesium transporter [Cellulomonas bogoriensis]KGM11510.1 magnesium transporter [Cellulomonas bogoriensis 69B4 = DSM 16987]
MTPAPLRDLLTTDNLTGLRAWLDDTGTLDIADELARLPQADQAVAFRLLPKDRAMAVFEALDPYHQQQLLDGLREDGVAELVAGMDPDDRARLLDEVPAGVASRLQAGLTPEQRESTASLLGYPPASAGRLMTPEYVSLRAAMTTADALSKLRRTTVDGDNLVVLPVTDDARHLVGTVALPSLVKAAPQTPVADLMCPELHRARAEDDREAAARLVQEADLLALPVVDSEDRLVGMITVDDAMEALEAEETEDIVRAGGSEPLGVPYMAASVFQLARKRAVWLLLLVVAAVLTVNVLQVFEDTLEAVIVLALFIPLLIDTGGNAGSQAATVVIRAMALGEVRFSDLPRIVWREARVGILLGAMLAGIGFPIAAVFFGPEVGLVISLTLLAICVWASFVGGMLPVLARRLGIDPAVVSAPLVTTLVDATGLILYFLIATAILSDQIGAATALV